VAVSGDVTVHHKDQVIVFRQVQTNRLNHLHQYVGIVIEIKIWREKSALQIIHQWQHSSRPAGYTISSLYSL